MERVVTHTVVSLVNWDVLRSGHLERQTYRGMPLVESIDTKIEPDVIKYAAYIRGTPWPQERCQEYFYFGSEGYGTVVCKGCLPAARYALFSVVEKAFIYLIHSHLKCIVTCLFCNRRMATSSIRTCMMYNNVEHIVKYEPKWKCIWTGEPLAKKRRKM